MLGTVSFFAFFVCGLSLAYQQREEPCYGNGGNCLPSAQCRADSRHTGMCPSQPSDIKCCLPYQENQCQSAGGVCQREDRACSGTYRSNLCPTQAANVKCCVSRSGTPTGEGCSGLDCRTEIPIPQSALTQSQSYLPVSTVLGYFGTPCTLRTRNILSSKLRPHMVTENVGPFNAFAQKPFLAALRAAFSALQAAKPSLYTRISNGGAFECKYIGRSTRWSNHAFGAAIDLKIDDQYDPYNNGKVFKAMAEIYPFMAAQGLYWGAGFSNEVGMHFEVSAQTFDQWRREGKI